jgi:sugar phosphate isomerase/epimerase
MDDLGIEYQTVLGFPPVDFVHLAADLGCRYISMKARGGGGPYNPYGHPAFSFLDDVSLRRRMIAAMGQRGVSVSLGEGFIVQPGISLLHNRASLDLMSEFGVTRVNAVTMDPDLNRSFDQFAAFAELAAQRGMETTMEFAKSLTLSDLDTALSAVRHVGRPDFRLLIDTMHVARSGSTAADLAAVDPRFIGYIQLSDSTVRQRGTTYRDDSSDRSIPGQGELPLVGMLLALPAGLPVGIESPMRSRAEQGLSVQECARLAVDGSRAVLAMVGAARSAS